MLMCYQCCRGVWAPTILAYFTAFASLVLCIIIVGGNVLIISTVIRDPYRNLRTPFNYFLVCLAVSDLVVGTVTMPLSVTIHLEEAWGRQTVLVKIMHVSYLGSMSASVLSLGALCVDRRHAICKPITYRSNLCLKRCLKISAGIWLLSLSLPVLYIEMGLINYLMVFIHLYVLVTFIILVVTYHQVDKKFIDQAESLKGSYHRSEIRKVKCERKVTRTFLVILVLFILAYTPAIWMIYTLQFCDQCSCTFRHILRDLQFLVICLNSAMNPIVCTVRLKPFRQAIKAILSCDRGTRVHRFNSTFSGNVTCRRKSELAAVAES